MSKKQRSLDYDQCLALMRKHDPQLQEEGFHALLQHAAAHVDALMTDFGRETDHGLRCWLLELIGEARSPRAFGLLAEQLASPDESLRDWGIRGLRALDTPEARKALFEAGVAKQGS
ncbi:MAG TPA: HEAT repeat domain-containing protein [Polyangiaceae bacterium]